MTKTKRISAIISSILAFSTVNVLSASASTTWNSVIVDNDTIASGCSNSGSSSLYAYKTGSNLYNSDARYVYTSSQSTRYRWTFPPKRNWSAQYFSARVYMYLNDSVFTDPYALYGVEHGTYGNTATVGTIDQDSAPSGWNSVYKSNIHSESLGGGFYIQSAVMSPSGDSSKGTGADAIQVQIIY